MTSATAPQLGAACGLSVVIAIVGVLGTWRTVGAVSLDGLEGPHDGWLVVIFAVVALAGVRSLSRGGWLGIVTVAVSASAALYTVLSNLVDDASGLGGTSGWGIWLTIAASGMLACCAVAAAVARGSKTADPTATPSRVR